MWLQDYRIDGLRLDSTVNIRNANGEDGPNGDLDDGWRFLSDLADTVHHHCPGKLLIAEDLQQNPLVTTSLAEGGLGFDLQWAAGFVHPVRAVLETELDHERDLSAVAAALAVTPPFRRVVYTESHDEVANGRTRITAEVDEDDPGSWQALRRAALGAVLVMAASDVPMLFQGQEWADEDWFDDAQELRWDRRDDRAGTVAMWRDLIRLRTGSDDRAGGLRGDQISVHRHGDDAVIGVLRWGVGGLDDATLIVANFSAHSVTTRIGVPAAGVWAPVFDSTWSGYHPTGADVLAAGYETVDDDCDSQPFAVDVTLDSYGAAILVRS